MADSPQAFFVEHGHERGSPTIPLTNTGQVLGELGGSIG